jgi:hypothetical protein
MAKIAFGKLGLVKNTSVNTVEHNGQIIEVKEYLPVNEKLELISNVINLAADENNFANPVKISVFATLSIIEAYTNITFTEKQKEDPTKIYDLFVSNGLSSLIFETIPKVELYELLTGIEDSVKAVYEYRSSVMGVLEAVQGDYSNMTLDAQNVHAALSDPDNLTLLKNVMTKLG